MTAHRSDQPDSVVTPDAVLSYVDGDDQFCVIVQQPTSSVVVIRVAGDIDLFTGPTLQTASALSWSTGLIPSLSI